MTRASGKLSDEDRIIWTKAARTAQPLKGKPPLPADESLAGSSAAMENSLAEAPAAPRALEPQRPERMARPSQHPLDQQTPTSSQGPPGPTPARRPAWQDARRSARPAAVVPVPGACERAPLRPGDHRQGGLVRQRRCAEAGRPRLAVDPAISHAGRRPRCRGAPAWWRWRHLHQAAAAQRAAPAMTPFGERLRDLRRARGVSQKQMAASLGVSAAYLSAREPGSRGAPRWRMVRRPANVIWDDAEELQRLAETSIPHRHRHRTSQGNRARQSAGGARCLMRKRSLAGCWMDRIRAEAGRLRKALELGQLVVDQPPIIISPASSARGPASASFSVFSALARASDCRDCRASRSADSARCRSGDRLVGVDRLFQVAAT